MKKLTPIYFVRFLAAIWVVLFHFCKHIPPFDRGVLNFFASHGDQAITFFFVLSGFIMSYVYHENAVQGNFGILNYWKARIARIVPLYLFALFFVSIAYAFFLNVPYPISTLLYHIFFIQSWVPGLAISLNYPGWSLSVEMFFYAIFPFLLIRMINKSSRYLIITSFIVWVVSQILYVLIVSYGTKVLSDYIYYMPLFHISTLFLGSAIGIIYVRAKNFPFQKFLSADFAVIILAVVIFCILHLSPFVRKFDHNGLLAPLYLIAILGLASNQGTIKRVSAFFPLFFLGEISYGIYILQYPAVIISGVLAKNFEINQYNIGYVLFILSITILLSTVCYYIIETPLRKYIKGM